MFEFFEHPSDIGIKGAGSSYEEAFIEAAKGMMSIMADLRCFTTEFETDVEVRGLDREFLFINFLNRILLEYSLHKAIWTDMEILQFSENHLMARLKGEKLKGIHKSELKVEVKAATLCELKVYEENGSYIAQCVLDI